MHRFISILRLSFVATALALGWLSFAHSTATVVREANPELALSLVRGDAVAAVNAIDANTIFEGSQAKMISIRASARAALENEPLSASALRILALLEYGEGNASEANSALDLSQKLSRREVAVQVGLIQRSVLRDDAEKALYHYDTALRISPGSQASLFPFMVAATAEQELLPAFAKILARGPEWRFPFYAALIEKTPSRENVAILYRSLVGTNGAFHEEATADLINRLASDKKYSLAYSVYSQAVPDAVKNPVSLNQSSRFQPFDWLLFDNPEAGAFLASRNENSKSALGLFFRAEAGADQSIARKLVTLPAGRYQIQAQVRNAPETKTAFVYWSIKCADGLELAGRDGANRPRIDFAVPTASCNAQWIDLNVAAKEQPVSGQIDKVTLISR